MRALRMCVSLSLAIYVGGCAELGIVTQSMQCDSVRRNVEAAQKGFEQYMQGAWQQRDGDEKEWIVTPPLDDWSRCKVRVWNAGKTRRLECSGDVPSGQFGAALNNYKEAVAAVRNCVVRGSVNPYTDMSDGGSYRTTTFKLDQGSDEKYSVEITLLLMRYSRSEGGGSRVGLRVEADRRYLAVK